VAISRVYTAWAICFGVRSRFANPIFFMSIPAQSTPSPSRGKDQPADPSAAPIDADLDEHLHGFWQKYGQAFLVACGLVLVAYLGKAGWDYIQAQREVGVREEYAAAALPEQLTAFIAAHPGHELAAVAQLQLADQAYAAGRSTEAVTAYTQAADLLKGGPLAGRAEIGLAMAQIQGGQTADGQANLHRIADDPTRAAVLRAEAGYQLASLAAAAGHADEVQKIALQLMQVDPSSPWTQRAFSLQATLPPAAAAAPSPGATPGISFKPADK
jgi:predicted negative regulator of RcsB-dependent stress response